MKKLFLFIIMFLSGSGMLWAQLTKTVEVNSYLDDNLYRSPEPVSDVLTNLYLGLSYQPEKSNVNYYYEANMFLYSTAADRNFHMHSLGFEYYNALGKNDKTEFYTGASWAMRFDNEEYNYYDYSQLNAYLNFKFNLDFFNLKSGYNFRYREYDQIMELSNFQNQLFVQANKTLPTKTSLILRADLGFKSFQNMDYTSSTGRGRGMYVTETGNSQIPSSQQAVLMGRIAQSFHDKLGLYVQYRQQFSFSDQSVVSASDGYFQDEELFDDPFSYESTDYSTQLSWIAPGNIKFQTAVGKLNKSYVSEQAFISAEDSIGLGGSRVDDRNYLNISLSKSFRFNDSWLNLMSIDLNYSYIKNSSNSYWYDYKNSMIGAGIQFGF